MPLLIEALLVVRLGGDRGRGRLACATGLIWGGGRRRHEVKRPSVRREAEVRASPQTA
ncbi:hypothetical protein CHELA41_23505 [Hyphomicrobiales bacterium]|nr:hypothetical protein CHELA41_23505 [Hyphomicrobiales bacterium]